MSTCRQRDLTDCGAACLRFIGAHYRRDVPVAVVATGGHESARLDGARARRGGEAGRVATIPLPAIAHCLIDQKLLHYVVLVEWAAPPPYTPPAFNVCAARGIDPAYGIELAR
jgi:hypothetical protein